MKRNEKFIGICQVRVLPPDKLFIPCLVHKMNGKLLFCLCQTCACGDNIQRKACDHDDMERSWIDVYTSTDIERAQKNGYKILEYKEIWHYKQGGGKIFCDLILNIVKRKIECSGFPVDCNTPEAKQKYVDT